MAVSGAKLHGMERRNQEDLFHFAATPANALTMGSFVAGIGELMFSFAAHAGSSNGLSATHTPALNLAALFDDPDFSFPSAIACDPNGCDSDDEEEKGGHGA